jgi:monoamine oxidase
MTVTRRKFIGRLAQAGGYGAAFAGMQALGLLGEADAEEFRPLPRDLGKGRTVVILGAGIAGMVAAYELGKAGFACTVLEARERPGGRNWTIRNGSTVRFTDGMQQRCEWNKELYFNAGPARIPSIHRTMLGYCQELGVRLEVEINTSRSALLQSDGFNGGRAVEQRQVVYDTRGHLSELFSKAIDQGKLDDSLTKEDGERLVGFLRAYGDLKDDLSYAGSERAGYAGDRSAGVDAAQVRRPIRLHDLLEADFVKGLFYEDRLDWQATMLQPVGGMDRIAYAFAEALGEKVNYGREVKEIRRTDTGAAVIFQDEDGAERRIDADFCICTLPVSILRRVRHNFSNAARQAIGGWSMMSHYKVAWQAPRFWERESHIYGGISFLNQTVDLVWYPSDRLMSSHGVLISGFNYETDDHGAPTEFGRLASIPAKLDASRAAVEKLHPGHGKDLTMPVYVSWPRIPYSLGCYANTHLASADAAYRQMHRSEGPIFFAGDYLSQLVGWQEGAALSARRVVAEIAART